MKIRSVSKILFIFVISLIVIAIVLLLCIKNNIGRFDPKRAFRDIEYQLNLGPRVPGSEAHNELIRYISNTLVQYGWTVELQTVSINNKQMTNIIAKRGSGADLIILGTHYDCRIYADNDPLDENRYMAVPGANDGASGVGVLLELGRTLPFFLDKELWLVFFDWEDQGRIADNNWIEGSRYFVNNLHADPKAVIIIDMIGDADLTIYKEKNSSQLLTDEIWSYASSLGYQSNFRPETKHSIIDDHSPFLERGIIAILIIDIEYQYWHTIQDTLDKVSSESLQAVGDTLYNWLVGK